MYQVQVSWPYLSSAVLPAAIPGSAQPTPAGMAIIPRIDIAESRDELIYLLEMPGARAEDIDISVDQGELVVQARPEEPTLPEGFVYSYQERPRGNYHRRLGLGTAADAERIQATFKNGILEIRIPRRIQAAGGRKVRVAGATSQTTAAGPAGAAQAVVPGTGSGSGPTGGLANPTPGSAMPGPGAVNRGTSGPGISGAPSSGMSGSAG